MVDVNCVSVLERQQLRPAVVDRQHRRGKRTLQRRVLVEIGNDDFRVGVAFELDDDARVFVRLIADVADVGQHFFVHQLRDALNQRGAVHAIRNLRDNDLFTAALEFFYSRFAAHFNTATAGFEILANPVDATDHAAGREVRALHVLHQLIQRNVGIVDLLANAIDDFHKIVRRNVGGHADGDAGPPVNKQVRKCSWENFWFGARLVVIGDKIDRVLLHVGHQRRAEMGHARFGVAHRCWRIAFDGSEIPLAVDQPFTHSPRLRHVDQRGIDHCFAVRVIVTAGVAADLCAFTVLPSWEKRQVVHRVENSPLRWLESVARIRQRARNDDRHRVIEK